MTDAAPGLGSEESETPLRRFSHGVVLAFKEAIVRRVCRHQRTLVCGDRFRERIDINSAAKNSLKLPGVFRKAGNSFHYFVVRSVSHFILIDQWLFGLLFK